MIRYLSAGLPRDATSISSLPTSEGSEGSSTEYSLVIKAPDTLSCEGASMLPIKQRSSRSRKASQQSSWGRFPFQSLNVKSPIGLFTTRYEYRLVLDSHRNGHPN